MKGTLGEGFKARRALASHRLSSKGHSAKVPDGKER